MRCVICMLACRNGRVNSCMTSDSTPAPHTSPIGYPQQCVQDSRQGHGTPETPMSGFALATSFPSSSSNEKRSPARSATRCSDALRSSIQSPSAFLRATDSPRISHLERRAGEKRVSSRVGRTAAELLLPGPFHSRKPTLRGYSCPSLQRDKCQPILSHFVDSTLKTAGRAFHNIDKPPSAGDEHNADVIVIRPCL